MNAEQFNAAHPIGTPVVAYPLTRPEHGMPEFFERLETVTRTPAWTLGCGTPVVSVDGYAGGINLTHIDVIQGDHVTDPNTVLGPELAALLTTAEQRQTAVQIVQQITEREGDDMARAWLIGMNPHLDDGAPLLAIADGRTDEVQAAARAYLNGVWA